jgi:hypothetical protein
LLDVEKQVVVVILHPEIATQRVNLALEEIAGT